MTLHEESGVLECWLHQRTCGMMSVLALGNCDNNFSHFFFDILWTKCILSLKIVQANTEKETAEQRLKHAVLNLQWAHAADHTLCDNTILLCSFVHDASK